MKRFFFSLLFLIVSCTFLFAQHGHNRDGHSSSIPGKSIFKTDSKGYKVEGWINDIESAMKAMMKDSNVKIDMSKMNPDLTHHIFFNITPPKKDIKIKSVKLRLTFNEKTKDYELMFMQGHYGADVSMKEKGNYKATLTIEPESGEKVLFNFYLKN